MTSFGRTTPSELPNLRTLSSSTELPPCCVITIVITQEPSGNTKNFPLQLGFSTIIRGVFWQIRSPTRGKCRLAVHWTGRCRFQLVDSVCCVPRMDDAGCLGSADMRSARLLFAILLRFRVDSPGTLSEARRH